MTESHSHVIHHIAAVLCAAALTCLGAVALAPSAVASQPASAAGAGLPINSAQHTHAQLAAQAKIIHPGADHLGSTVAAHEGSHGPRTLSAAVTQTPGLDVSGYQTGIDWGAVAADGAKFAYVKATEATGYRNPEFANQYDGAYQAGIIRGAYHFATPNTSAGAAQADYFVDNGGGWSRDGMTLPPMLDIEYNPYGDTCYGLSQAAMSQWIADFSNEVQARTSRWPTIYTTTDWWSTCTGDNAGFGANNPLFIANYNGSPGVLPNGWGFQTIWQYADSGTFPGDQDQFNGDYSRVQALANG